MSEINYQALREVAERAIPAMERLLMLPADDDLLSEQELKDYGVDIDALNAFKFLTGPETVLALLDELESAEKRIAEQREYYEGVIADGSRRIAELEAKIETSDKLQDSAFRHGLQHGFSFGQTDNQAGFEECLSAYGARGKDNG
ncbi:ead/Ea22-like family protein [Shigella boydii]|nr:ead/Ea22-like family protein [Shigella boydii]